MPDSDDQANRGKKSSPLQSCCERKRRATVVTDNMQIIGISRRSRSTDFSRRARERFEAFGEWTFGLACRMRSSEMISFEKPRPFVVTDDDQAPLPPRSLLFLTSEFVVEVFDVLFVAIAMAVILSGIRRNAKVRGVPRRSNKEVSQFLFNRGCKNENEN